LLSVHHPLILARRACPWDACPRTAQLPREGRGLSESRSWQC
jgi:hypothetical protein